MAVFSGPEIVNNGLVLHLDAANQRSYPGSGTVWRDMSGRGNDGTLVNGVAYSTSNKGLLTFDGVDDYVNLGSANAYLNTNLTGLTVSSWIRITQKRTAIIGENGTSFSTNTFYIAQENTNNLSFLVANPSNAVQRVYGTASYDTNVWYHFCGVWKSGETIRAYVNGEDTSRDVLNPSNIFTTLRQGNSDLWLGRRPGGSILFFGDIAHFSISNRALSAAEIRQNFEATRSRYGI